jgi:hypothetical protein
VAERDFEVYGEYRTKRLIGDCFEQFAGDVEPAKALSTGF